MSGNSLETVLARMREGSVTQGWGAVSVFNRARLNRLLEQQYIERFNDLSFLPPFMGKDLPSDDGAEHAELGGIALGKPLLSFNTASLTNSRALLTMNIVSGRYSTVHQPTGVATTRLSMVTITEPLGFKLEMDIDLSLVVGEVDRQGKVTLNLAEAANFRCNLAGSDEAANIRLAEYFQQSFVNLPPHRSVFQLGMLDLKGYRRLTPVKFRIATQAAPGAKVRGASNFGEGAVVVFIQLQGNTGEGTFPPGSGFPYLIPDDQEADGSDRYSASLILSDAMIPYIDGNRLDVLNNLLFPGEHVFEERERHTPRDLAVFGNISPKRTLYTLEPRFKTIKAGETQRFTLHNWKGEVIQASRWQAVSLQSHRSEGHGIVVDGLYTAASSALIGHDCLHVVVTAEYVEAKTTYRASALLLVVFESMAISPLLAAYPLDAQPQPILLAASQPGDNPVKWIPLMPARGTLVQQGSNQAVFTADAKWKAKGLVAQQLEAQGDEKKQASLLMVNAQQLLQIDPPYGSWIKPSAPIPLLADTMLLPDLPRRWKVISGGGSVDAAGRYSAPAQGGTGSSVVQCEIVRNGVVFSSGYSVIELSELEPEPTWETLTQFTIKVPGGLDSGRLGTLYANGYQPLRVQIVTETALVDKIAYPLSVIERASMRLTNNTSKAEIPFVDAALEGIPEGDEDIWQTRLIPNRFELAVPRNLVQDNLQADGSITVQDFYLHSREIPGVSTTFHARFQKDDFKWMNSTDITDLNNKIDVTPLAPPAFVPSDYTFERVRVDGGSAGTGGPDDDDEDFDFHLRTVDYWKLQYLPASFETLEFLPIDGKEINTSTIRWESEQSAEIMFSWTGSVFRDPLKPDDDPVDSAAVKKVLFDEDLKDVVKTDSLDIAVDETVFEQGKLVISLHRSDTVPYVSTASAVRTKLSRDLAVLLIDKHGNAHKRRISFLPASTVGDRNRLVHTLFTPVP